MLHCSEIDPGDHYSKSYLITSSFSFAFVKFRDGVGVFVYDSPCMYIFRSFDRSLRRQELQKVPITGVLPEKRGTRE